MHFPLQDQEKRVEQVTKRASGSVGWVKIVQGVIVPLSPPRCMGGNREHPSWT